MFKELQLDINYNEIVDFVLKVADERMPEKNTFGYQIATQCREGVDDFEKQLTESTMSFNLDWDKFDPETMDKPPAKPFDEWLFQKDFVLTPDYFKGTPIETLNNYLYENFKACRGRIMNMHHKSALSWHYDDSPRLHIPIKINKGSFMVLEDNVYRFEVGKSYWIDTTKMHTAVNADFEYRIHLVYCVENGVIGTESP